MYVVLTSCVTIIEVELFWYNPFYFVLFLWNSTATPSSTRSSFNLLNLNILILKVDNYLAIPSLLGKCDSTLLSLFAQTVCLGKRQLWYSTTRPSSTRSLVNPASETKNTAVDKYFTIQVRLSVTSFVCLHSLFWKEAISSELHVNRHTRGICTQEGISSRRRWRVWVYMFHRNYSVLAL